MADTQQFQKKSRNMIRIERMFIFKQKIRYGIKFILRIVQRKILWLQYPQARRFLDELFK